MQWLRVFLLLAALICSALGQDFTSKYAELAAPVPPGMNVDALVANLRSDMNHS